MSSERRPWYKWFPGRFHTDNKVQMLPEVAKYVYRDVLDLMWESSDTKIPNDINLLYECIGGRIANALRPYGVSFALEQFEQLWSRIQYPGYELFRVTEDGKWLYSKRLLEQIEEIERKKNVGKKAAFERWKQTQSECNANASKTHQKRNTDIDKDIDKNKTPIVPFKKIVSHLNEKAGTNFKHTTKDTQSHIRARFNEGFTVEDFMKVIDGRVSIWKSDPKMVEYLRPKTLFGTKFESYLNSNISGRQEQVEQYPPHQPHPATTGNRYAD